MNTPNPKMMQILGAMQREPAEGDENKPKTWWTRIGVAFLNRDDSINLLFDFVPTRLDRTTIQLRDFDGNDTLARVLGDLTHLQILGAVQRETDGADPEGPKPKTWWTRIGAGFVNRDRSMNLRFDFIPTRIDRTTIQLRRVDPKEPEHAAPGA